MLVGMYHRAIRLSFFSHKDTEKTTFNLNIFVFEMLTFNVLEEKLLEFQGEVLPL